ncbi:MAG: tRNA pseudouridine(55) synthase TruB [candidate division Zixibacteria bacterium]|nr:tRNA pseudouridine(55) synthase TruB [candidate division Zixibacteria bacterium]
MTLYRRCLEIKSGIIAVEKPAGWTSHDVVGFCRKRWKIKKVGHTGTLDPMAEGVLILCFGAATKLSILFSELPKTYQARIRFGIKTDTDDITGNIIEEKDINFITDTHIHETSNVFRGKIKQVPPRISAIKIKGKRAYKKARRHDDFILRERDVEIYDLDIDEIDMPEISVRVKCGSGTYIRSIARDWGEIMGVGGTLSQLRRTEIGHINSDICHKIEDLRAMESLPFLPLKEIFNFLPVFEIDESTAETILKGNEISHAVIPEIDSGYEGTILLFYRERPIALMETNPGKSDKLKYLRVLHEWK